MTPEQYNELADTIRSGRVVHFEGRTAVSLEDLDFIAQASPSVEPDPGAPAPPRTPDLTGMTAALNGMSQAVRALPDAVTQQITPLSERITALEAAFTALQASLDAIAASAKSPEPPAAPEPEKAKK